MIRVKKSIFKKGLDLIGKSVSNKNIVPIAGYILMKSEGEGKVTLSATNLDISTIAFVDGFEYSEPFNLTIEFSKLNNVVNKLSEDEITITIGGNDSVELKCGKNKFKLRSLPASDFPDIKPSAGAPLILIEADKVVKIITSNVFAASNENIKPALTAVSLKLLEDGTIESVATNSHRLAMLTQKSGYTGEEKQLLIPASSMSELSRLINLLKPSTVEFYQQNKNIGIKVGNVQFITKTIEANYPNYRAVIKDGILAKTNISRNELLKEVSIVDSIGADVITLSFSKNVLSISAQNPNDNSTAQGEIPIQYVGDTITTVFNTKYLVDVLKNTAYETISIDMGNSGGDPTIIFPENNLGEYKYLIMPIKQ